MKREKTFEEWIDFYNSKTPTRFIHDEEYSLFFSPVKGFCEMGVDKEHGVICLNQTAGDGRWWKRFAEKIAQGLNIKKGTTFLCRRAVLAYIRLFDYKVKKTRMVGKSPKYVCRKNSDRKYFVAAPTGLFNDGVQLYHIEWEV